MPKVFKNADFGRVAYSIFVLAAISFVVFSFVLPETTVKAQKSDETSGKASKPVERLATMTFSAAGLPAAIPDNSPPGVNIPILVSGLTDNLRGVALNLTFNPIHTWAGDLNMTLFGPGGAPSHLIFQRIGSTSGTGGGDGSDLQGPYTFTDGSTGDIWIAADVAAPIVAPGSYRTTACCAPIAAGPAIFTEMNPVFEGPVLAEIAKSGSEGYPANVANGLWTVNISDNALGDTGSISNMSLTLTTLAPTAGFAGIRGTVVTPAGRPISHARVSILNAETLETFTATTNNFGYFTFESLPVENFYTMWVEHGRYQFSKQVQSFVLIGDIENARFISLTQ